jgi:hypothetical protein
MAAPRLVVTATGRARTVNEVGQAALEILCRATGADSGLVASSDGAFEPIATYDANPATIELLRALGGPATDDDPGAPTADAFISADVATAPLLPEVRAALARRRPAPRRRRGPARAGRLIGGLRSAGAACRGTSRRRTSSSRPRR